MPMPRDWARALADPTWEASAVVLKQQGGRHVRRATLLGREVVVKTQPSSGVLGAIRAALRLSRAWRQVRGAARLERAGIPTARALAVVRARGHEHLILPALRGETVLSLIVGGDLPKTRAAGLARALGRQVARLDSIGLFNRDHKPSNLVVTGWAGDDPTIAVVDTVAIQRRRALPRMLFALLVEPLGVGAPPRRTERMRVLLAALDSVNPGLPRPARRAPRDRWWAEIRAMLEAHGDPSPRVLPLRASENRSAARS